MMTIPFSKKKLFILIAYLCSSIILLQGMDPISPNSTYSSATTQDAANSLTLEKPFVTTPTEDSSLDEILSLQDIHDPKITIQLIKETITLLLLTLQLTLQMDRDYFSPSINKWFNNQKFKFIINFLTNRLIQFYIPCSSHEQTYAFLVDTHLNIYMILSETINYPKQEIERTTEFTFVEPIRQQFLKNNFCIPASIASIENIQIFCALNKKFFTVNTWIFPFLLTKNIPMPNIKKLNRFLNTITFPFKKKIKHLIQTMQKKIKDIATTKNLAECHNYQAQDFLKLYDFFNNWIETTLRKK